MKTTNVVKETANNTASAVKDTTTKTTNAVKSTTSKTANVVKESTYNTATAVKSTTNNATSAVSTSLFSVVELARKVKKTIGFLPNTKRVKRKRYADHTLMNDFCFCAFLLCFWDHFRYHFSFLDQFCNSNLLSMKK